MQNVGFTKRKQVFLALAPETDEITPTSLDLMTFWPWLQSRQYQSQKCSFNDFLALVPETDDFLALAPEADKIRFRSLD